MQRTAAKSVKGVRQADFKQTQAFTHQLSRAERYAAGKRLREACPRSSHAVWKAPAGRPDPVDTVLAAEKGRVPGLLPLRHGRMVRSPFTFYRGSALAHARSGNPAMISGYLGKSDAFDKAIAAFSFAYADQNEKDHAALKRAVRQGKVKAEFEENS